MSAIIPSSSPRLVVAGAILLLTVANPSAVVHAQVGVTLCACSPATYTFQLNFDFTCNDTSISGAGLNRTECFVSPFGFNPENVTDFVPVAINAVDILELDQQLAPFTLTPIREDFRDGNEFKYTSITATDPNLTSSMIPGGLQMNIIGVNELDEPIQNVWIIVFNNDCGIFPIYTVGEQIGWTLMTDLTLPNALYCPAYTASPTSSPAGPNVPSSTPTSSPSAAPATAAPGTVEPTVSQPLTSMAPATIAPSERVCPPIIGKGKGSYSPSSSSTSSAKKPTGPSNGKGGSSSKAGKEAGSSKGSLAGSLRSKYVKPDHTDKKSKYESKKHEKLEKPSYSDTSSKGVESGKAGKSMSFRRLPSSSTPAPSSSSSSVSKGSEPASNIYKMSTGKGQEASSMDSGKGISVSKGYVMYDPHCYPPKKSRSSSASQMSKTSESKGSTSGKSISIEGSKGSSSESGKGTSDETGKGSSSTTSVKGSSGKGKGQSESYKTKKQGSASSMSMSMSKLHSSIKSGKEASTSGKEAHTHSVKGASKPSYNSEDMPGTPSKEPITKPSPISPPPPKGKGSDDTDDDVPSAMSASTSVKHKTKKSQASEKHSMLSKTKSLKYPDKAYTKPSYDADEDEEEEVSDDEDESLPTHTPTYVDHYQNATTTPNNNSTSSDHNATTPDNNSSDHNTTTPENNSTDHNTTTPDTDHVDIVEDIEQQEDVGNEPTVGGSGGIDIFGIQEGAEEEGVVSYQAEEEKEHEKEAKDEHHDERRVHY